MNACCEETRGVTPVLALVLVLYLHPFGCIHEVATPSAYASEQALCPPTESAEWRAQIAACRQRDERGTRCAGWLSISGRLAQTPVVLTTELTEAFAATATDELETFLRQSWFAGDLRQIRLRGAGPYFNLELEFDDLGGLVPEEAAPESRHHPFGNRAPRDPSTRASLGIVTSSSTRKLNGTQGELELIGLSQAETEGQFQRTSGDEGDTLVGCFFARFAPSEVSP